MTKIIERTKYVYGNLGYHAPDHIYEGLKDVYEARGFVRNKLELLKAGDSKWHESEQEFDSKSIYLTDGHYIQWYEFIEE